MLGSYPDTSLLAREISFTVEIIEEMRIVFADNAATTLKTLTERLKLSNSHLVVIAQEILSNCGGVVQCSCYTYSWGTMWWLHSCKEQGIWALVACVAQIVHCS
jgi:hypothetical protein